MRDKPLIGRLLPLAQELRRRKDHPLFTYQPDDHQERPQLQFHQSDADIRLVQGGNQSGKSRVIAQEIAWYLTGCHPHKQVPRRSKIYLISAYHQTLEEGVWRHLKALIPPWLIEREGPSLERTTLPAWIRMRNGSILYVFSAVGGDEGRRKIQSTALDLIAIDEEVDRGIFEEGQMRLVARGGKMVIGATLVRSEPWIIQLEHQAGVEGSGVQLFRFNSRRAAEVGHISKKALEKREASMSEAEKEVRILGKSRVRHELVYPEFDAQVHFVKPFEIPLDWTRYCAIDPGWRTCAVLWAAVNPLGEYFLYRELYVHGAKYKDVANRIYRAEGYEYVPDLDRWRFIPGQTEAMRIRWIDPAGFAHSIAGELGPAVLFTNIGISVCPAQNDREGGIEKCRLDLELGGMTERPRMRVFNTLNNFRDEIIGYRRTPDNRDRRRRERKDDPLKRDDHLMDCWRYLRNGGLKYHPPKEGGEPPPSLWGGLPPKSHVRRARLRLASEVARDVEHPGGMGSEY